MVPVILAGTRPEIIKLWPVYLAFKEKNIVPIWVHSGQHDSMAFPLYKVLDITPDYTTALPVRDSSLSYLGSRLLEEIDGALQMFNPDVVLVQGDTHTVFFGSLACFYRGIPIAHVEAGLRTGNLASPFPEEANRQLASRLARYHFCPSHQAVLNLLVENIYHKIYEVGNTVVDAVKIITDGWCNDPDNYIVVTLHRRENMDNLPEMLEAIKRIAVGGTEVFFPVHASPAVSSLVYRSLQGVKGVHLSPPMIYPDFVRLLNNSKAIITDSGGVQEEAVTLRKPLIICRDTTERPEAVSCGCGVLAGRNPAEIIHALHQVAGSPLADYENPFGDGYAAQKIVDILIGELK